MGPVPSSTRARPLRVFLSHTSELREGPQDRSFVAAAEAAVIRLGHGVSDMAYFAARDTNPADYSIAKIREADVYVGIVGHEYGTPVRDRKDISYTELEFETATALALPRLVFLRRDDDQGRPVHGRHDEHAARQEAFRRRLLQDSHLTVKWFGSPAELELELLHALMELETIVVNRRQFLIVATAALVGPSLVDATPAPDGIGAAERFRLMRKALADSDNLFGPREVIPTATRQVQALQRAVAAARGADRQELLHVQAQFADLLGWLHQDSCNFAASQYWMDRALELAHLSRTRDAVVFVLARKSQLAGDVQDPVAAVGFAEAAMSLAPPRSRLAAIAATYAAHGHALHRDRASSDRLYDQARSLLQQAEHDDSPFGMFFDAAYIAVQRAGSAAVLGDHREAAEGFQAAIDGLQHGFHRDRGVYLARQAVAYAAAGEVEHAARLGAQALAIGAETSSDRILTQLTSLDGVLGRRSSVGERPDEVEVAVRGFLSERVRA